MSKPKLLYHEALGPYSAHDVTDEMRRRVLEHAYEQQQAEGRVAAAWLAAYAAKRQTLAAHAAWLLLTALEPLPSEVSAGPDDLPRGHETWCAVCAFRAAQPHTDPQGESR